MFGKNSDLNTYSDETDVKEPIILTEIRPLNAPDVRNRLIIDRKEEESNEEPNNRNNSIDVGIYSMKKSIAQGMLDLSLISANCSQLKYLLYHYERGAQADTNKANDYYFIINLSCIAVSIGLQVLVGILLICNVKHNISTNNQYLRVADSLSNWILIMVFIITVINIFLSIFISAQ